MTDTDTAISPEPEEPPRFLVIAADDDDSERLTGTIHTSCQRSRIERLRDPAELEDALSAARAADPDGPVIVIGGALGPDAVATLLRGAADDYLCGDDAQRLDAAIEHASTQALRRRHAHALEDELRNVTASLSEARAGAAAALDDAARANSRVEALLDHVPVPFSIKDPTGGYLAFSPGAAELAGLPSDASPHANAPLYTPAVSPLIADHEARVRATGESVSFELSLPDSSGSTRDYLCTKFPVLDAECRVAGIGGIAIDVSDRKRAELGARALIESTLDGVLLADREGRVLLVNDAAERLFGYRADELLGTPITRIVPELDCTAHAHAHGAQDVVEAAAVRSERLTLSARPKEGPELTVEIRVSAFRGDDQPLLVVSVVDAALVRAQARAREDGDARLRSAFADAPVGMALIGLDGGLLCVNRVLCEIVGFSEADLLALDLDELTHPDDLARDAEGFAQLRAGGRASYRVQRRYYHRRGHSIWINVSAAVARDGDGNPLHVIAAFEDISPTKAAESALREANAQLQAIFDHAPAWLTLSALDGRFLNANDQLIRSLNTTRQELIGSHPGSHLDPSTAAQIHAEDHQVWETREPVSSEISLPGAGGDLHTYQVVRYPVLDDAGEVSAFGSFALDVTDRARSDRARERAIAEFEEAQRIARVGSWTWDPATGTAAWSRQMCRIFGIEPGGGQVEPEAMFAAAAPDDRERVMDAHRTRFAAAARFELDYQIVGRDGVERSLHVLGRRDEDGCLRGTCQDVTELRAAERQLRVAEQRFRKAFEHAPVGMLLADLDGHFVKVNDALCAMLGYRPEELLSTTYAAITHPEDAELGAEQTEQLLRGEIEHFQREKRYLRAVGEPLWVAVHTSVLRDRDGRPLQFVQQVVDITERRRLERELRHLADHDPLTGLLNRRGLEAELERHVTHVNRYGDRGALLVLDLDHFKAVNDTLGHEAGDRLIVSVAGILAQRLRDADTVARLGGDEFAILLPEADAESAQEVAAQLVSDIHANAIASHGLLPHHITASIGVTTFRQGLAGGEEALVNADIAMYEAKEAGRDRLAVHAPDRGHRSRTEARQAWIERLNEALANDQLSLVAQPIVALSSGQPVAQELLLRLSQASGDSIPPGAFLYIAERYDLVQELDRWVVEQAIRLLETDGPEAAPGALGVNVSAKSLADDDLLELVERELQRSGIDPERLIFEVSETAAIANVQLARGFSEQLHQLGCRFALDDFGAGFGSFYYLKHIPFDVIKIDGELISGCRTNHTDRLVIESLVAIARGLGKQTVAKGVEDTDTHQFLYRAGVDLAQGYHFGRPAPVALPPAVRAGRANEQHVPEPIRGRGL